MNRNGDYGVIQSSREVWDIENFEEERNFMNDDIVDVEEGFLDSWF